MLYLKQQLAMENKSIKASPVPKLAKKRKNPWRIILIKALSVPKASSLAGNRSTHPLKQVLSPSTDQLTH
jgi:hypothetical protein